jgi:hypothetical protein
VDKFTLRPFYPRERRRLTIEQDAAWASELAWTSWKREKYLFPDRILNPDRPTPVSMPMKKTLAQPLLPGT